MCCISMQVCATISGALVELGSTASLFFLDLCHEIIWKTGIALNLFMLKIRAWKITDGR